MLKIDPQYNQQVRQRFSDKCHFLQLRIDALQAGNETLANKLSVLIERRKVYLNRLRGLVKQ